MSSKSNGKGARTSIDKKPSSDKEKSSRKKKSMDLESQEDFFELQTIEIKFKDRPKHALSVELSKDSKVIEKNKVQVNSTGVMKWELNACNVDMNFDKLEVCIKENALFRKKDLVQYKMNSEEIHELFQNHSVFPKTLKKTDTKIQAELTIYFGGIVSLDEIVSSTMTAVSRRTPILDALGPVQGFLEAIMKVGEVLCDLHPAVYAAMAAVTAVYETLKSQQETHGVICGLLLGIVGMLPFTDVRRAQFTKFSLTKQIIKDILVLIKDICDFVRKYLAKSTMRIFFSYQDQITLAEYNDALAQLKESYDRCVNREIWQTALSLEKRQALSQLRLAPRSQYDSSKGVLVGTREKVMQKVMDWVAREDIKSRLFWLYGIAGCGKSAVANSFAAILEDQYALAGSFFCKYDTEQLRDPFNVLPSLAYGLAVAHKPFADFLIQALESDPEAAKGQIATQFKKLFKDPLAKMGAVKDLIPDTPYVFVIDAMDECGNVQGRSTLLECLCEITQLVSWLKVFITSRPLPDIQQVFRKAAGKGIAYTDYELSLVDAEQDIVMYTQYHVSEIAKEKELEQSWPGESVIQQLAKLSKGLFVWISTVITLIKKSFDAVAKLKSILRQSELSQASADAALDQLYTFILNSVVEGEDAENVEALKWTLVSVVATSKHSPVTPDALSPLMPTSQTPVMVKNILKHLQAVMTIDKENGNVIRLIHPSFMDYVVDKKRCPTRFWVDPQELNVQIATKCYEVMFKELKFNISGLESSYIPNKQINLLNERVEKSISMQLKYGCLYWSDHIVESGAAKLPDRLQTMLEEFVQKPLVLYWIEALSLMEETHEALTILNQSTQIESIKASTRAVYFDLNRFVHAFYDAIQASTPHLYISAMTWAPRSSYVATALQHTFSKGLKITGALQRTWPVLVRDIDPNDGVMCIACSPNGQRMACGYFNGSLAVWNIKTGVEVCAPFESGPSNVEVVSIAYSPDGRHVAAGYANGQVCVWDTEDNRHTSFVAHSVSIASIVYCSSGRYIVTASDDKTARVWHSTTHTEIGLPFEGHDDAVTSVAISPDEKHAVTGSLDGTIRIWDFARRNESGRRLLGHQKGVTCVRFSHCGKMLASGSYDNSIIIWDFRNREQIGKPLTGHVNLITSVAFTWDANYLASASVDETIRIWDVHAGVCVGDPLYGPRGSFTSVEYTSDGQYLVSGVHGTYREGGLHNGELCIWDAKASTTAGDAPIGLGGSVFSVSCSPDGKHIAAGLRDHAQLYETMTGKLLGVKMKAHSDEVTSIAHSPSKNHLATSSRDGTVIVWDLDMQKVVCKTTPGHQEWLNDVAYSPDGKRIASASNDKTIRIWDALTGEPVGTPLIAHSDTVRCLVYRPTQGDQHVIASGSQDANIIVWNLSDSSHQTLSGHEKTIRAIDYDPSGKRLASCSEDTTIRIWDPITCATLTKLDVNKIMFNLCSIKYSPDGQYLTCGAESEAYCIWDTNTYKALGSPLIGHNGWITSLSYTLDGAHLITASIDHTVRLLTFSPPDAVYAEPSVSSINQKCGSFADLMECFVQAVGPSYAGYELKAKNRVPDDGWIRTASGELMLWVPPRYRKLVVDRSWICFGYETIGLDCRNFAFGNGWADMKPLED